MIDTAASGLILLALFFGPVVAWEGRLELRRRRIARHGALRFQAAVERLRTRQETP